MPLTTEPNTIKRTVSAEMRERFDRHPGAQRAQEVADLLNTKRWHYTRSPENTAADVFAQMVTKREQYLTAGERERLYKLSTDQLLSMVDEIAREIEFGRKSGWIELFKSKLPSQS